jgi:hypothetical protein
LKEVEMANDSDYDYKRGRYDRDFHDEPYDRSHGGHEEPYHHAYDGEPTRYGYGRGSYDSEPHWSRRHGGYYNEPYDSYDYGRYEYGYCSRESYYRSNYEVRYRALYYHSSYKLGAEGLGPRGYRRSDERIHEDINDRLTDDWRTDASDIEVTVNNGMVTLTGRVDSREEKRRAEDIAESVSGVTDVSNQLRVGPSAPITARTAGATRAKTAGA